MPLKNNWQNGEQFNASDANAVADAVNAAYVKDAGGIPKADLAAAVQVSLGKADTAVQAVSASSISDSTATGRSVLTAADAAAARTALGVAYGSTSGTVVQGNDSRLSPTASSITDSTATGRAVLTATDATAARATLGVAYGTTAGTVCQGNDSRLSPTAASITDSTATGQALMTAATAAAARTTLGVAYGTTSGTVCQGNDSRLSNARTPTAAGQVADLSIVAFGSSTTRATGTGDFPFGVKLQRAVTFSSVTYRVATADASGNLVVELRKNGVAVSGSSATIAAASQVTGGTATGSWAFASGDVITVQVTGVGTTPGRGLIADVAGLTT